MKIRTEASFEAAHMLGHLPDGHKCKNLHGHNYHVEVVVEGPIDERGFVMDYAELEDMLAPLIKTVDHRYLNDIPGLAMPTTEVLVRWFLDRLCPQLGGKTVTVRINETPRYWAEETR